MSNDTDTTDRESLSEIAAIVARSKEAHDALVRLDKEIEEQIDALDRRAFARGRQQNKPPIYQPGETAQRKRLRDSQSELADNIIVLAAITAAELSNSNTVTGLRDRMQTVNSGLQETLNRLGKIEKFAETTAQVATSVEKAVLEVGRHAMKMT